MPRDDNWAEYGRWNGMEWQGSKLDTSAFDSCAMFNRSHFFHQRFFPLLILRQHFIILHQKNTYFMQHQQATIFCFMEHSIYRIRIACEVGQSRVAITSSGLQCVTQLLPGREIQTIFVIIISWCSNIYQAPLEVHD